MKDSRKLLFGREKFKSSRKDRLVPGGRICVKFIGDGIVMSMASRLRLSRMIWLMSITSMLSSVTLKPFALRSSTTSDVEGSKAVSAEPTCAFTCWLIWSSRAVTLGDYIEGAEKPPPENAENI